MTLFAAIVMGIIVFCITFATWITPYPPFELHVYDRVQGPSAKYWLGTDEAGRDLLSLLIHAGRNTLMAATLAELVGLMLGLPFGLVAGFWRGKSLVAKIGPLRIPFNIDDVIMRFMDGLMAFPGVLLALTIVGLFGTSLRNLILAIAITFVPGIARIIRASVIQEREREYVLAAHALGVQAWRIAVRHILPNAAAPIIVQISLGIAVAILIEASLSFLGLGIQPPKASWGIILSEGFGYLTRAPTFVTFPGLFIFVTAWTLNVLGDGLRDTLDPRLRGT